MPFKPGQSGNPLGRQRGTRIRITEAFLNDFFDAWRQSGVKALRRLATYQPDKFCALAASLLPRKFEIGQPLNDVDDIELAAMIAEVREQIDAKKAKATLLEETPVRT